MPLTTGDRAPLFAVRNENGGYWLSAEAGKPVVVSFVDELDAYLRDAAERYGVVWVVKEPREPQGGVTVIVDDGQIAEAYGIGKASVLLDANLRALDIVPAGRPVPRTSETDLAAPLLVVPRVLEPEFCRELVAEYERKGGADSGFMRSDEQGRFEGGELRFPEFGRRTYLAAPGDALVFSCSLLHEVTPVTMGRRYCTLPFLYDEAAQRVREENSDQVRATAN